MTRVSLVAVVVKEGWQNALPTAILLVVVTLCGFQLLLSYAM